MPLASVMAHFVIVRIHLIRRGPSGGIPWLWPPSILLGGSDVLTYLGSVWVPHHPILLGPPPYRGGAWLNLAFSILQNAPHRKSRKTHPCNKGAFGFWAISFMWGFVVSLPHVLAAGIPLTSRPRLGRPRDLFAITLFIVGLALETTADLQKWQFKSEAVNAGRFCDVGVWQLSQHPNCHTALTLSLLCLPPSLSRASRSPAAI